MKASVTVGISFEGAWAIRVVSRGFKVGRCRLALANLC
jgi:hypothetical protein